MRSAALLIKDFHDSSLNYYWLSTVKKLVESFDFQKNRYFLYNAQTGDSINYFFLICVLLNYPRGKFSAMQRFELP